MHHHAQYSGCSPTHCMRGVKRWPLTPGDAKPSNIIANSNPFFCLELEKLQFVQTGFLYSYSGGNCSLLKTTEISFSLLPLQKEKQKAFKVEAQGISED